MPRIDPRRRGVSQQSQTKGISMNRVLLLVLLAFSTHASAALVCANDTYDEQGVWYVGQSTVDALGQIDTVGDVWCYATGAELAYIKSNFSGLRLLTGRTPPGLMWWQGEDAAFILNNL
jgi:hypothetical protein